tara:strand:- start:27065 stop:27283 length:219 start_codon:yes stop_codon:yes gene_type:complete
MDSAKLSKQIARIRKEADDRCALLLDRFMRKHYGDLDSFRAHCIRAGIEVDSWPAHKQRACYSQKHLQRKPS